MKHRSALTENVSIDLHDVNEEDRPTVGGAVHLWLTFLHQAIRLRNAYFAMLQRSITRDPPKHVRSPVAQVLEKRRPGPRT